MRELYAPSSSLITPLGRVASAQVIRRGALDWICYALSSLVQLCDNTRNVLALSANVSTFIATFDCGSCFRSI